MFNFVKNCQTVFQCAYILHSNQQWMRGFQFLHILFNIFLLSVFLTTAILVGVKCYLTMFLICISLMINNTECFSMCLLDIYAYSLERCLFKTFAHF